MSSVRTKRSALVLSTTPPIPREYGNRNRVFQTVEFLKSLGFAVSFLLYPFDEDWQSDIPPYYRELTEEFEYFAAIPNRKVLHRGAQQHHHSIDEWWDDTIGDHLTWLFGRKRFDVFFVNYTFLSKAFEFAPHPVVRILDTHDLFTGRRESFERHGVEPEFFYTTQSEEKKAFDRADAIIGIKRSEAEFIRTLTDKYVVTLPYWCTPPENAKQQSPAAVGRFDHERPLRLGFIGAQNSVNVVNMRRFLYSFDRYVKLYDLPVEVIVAGNVCRQLYKSYPFLKKLGRVADIEEFYGQVDAIIAPLEFSTGIKIKVGEALARELPVIATDNAFDGFRPFHKTQTERSVAQLCDSIADLATNELSFTEIRTAAKRAARTAAQAQQKGFSELKSWLKGRLRRIVVVTDRPFWYRGTLLDEWIAQSVEYISQVASTVVVLTSGEKPNLSRVHARAEYLHVDSIADVAALLDDLSAYAFVVGVCLFVDSSSMLSSAQQIESAGVRCWISELYDRQGSLGVRFRRANGNDPAIVVSPLRYAPSVGARALNPGGVTIFRPDNVSEWEALVLSYLEQACQRKGLTVNYVVPPPAYAQYDSEFLRRSLADDSAQLILLTAESITQLFVPQVAKYRGSRCLLLNPDLICPQVLDSASGLPSVTASIDAFLAGEGTACLPADPDSGWDRMWASLESHPPQEALA